MVNAVLSAVWERGSDEIARMYVDCDEMDFPPNVAVDPRVDVFTCVHPRDLRNFVQDWSAG